MWLHRLRAERDNLDAALAGALARTGDDPDLLLRIVGALGWWWYFGRHDEGRRWVDLALSTVTGGSPRARAAAHQAAALVWRPGACVVHPSPRCAREATASLAAAEDAAEAELAAYARVLLAVEAVNGEETVDAPALLGESDRVLAAAGDDWGMALVAFVRAETGFQRGELDAAARWAQRAAEGFAALGDGWGSSAVRSHHGGALRRAGRIAEALPLYEQAVRDAHELGLFVTVQWLEAELAYCALLMDDVAATRRHLEAASRAARLLPVGPGPALVRYVEAMADRVAGRCDEALAGFQSAGEELTAHGVTWVAAAVHRERHAQPADALERRDVDAAQRIASRCLGNEGFAAAFAAGRKLEPREAVVRMAAAG